VTKKSTKSRAEERDEPKAGGRERRERELLAPVRKESAEVGWALRAVLTRYGDVVQKLASQLSMPITDMSALEHLIQDTTLGPMDLAHRLGITSASATVLLDRLEKAGHVLRKPHPRDRRRRQLEVTPGAQAQVLGALAPLFEALEQHDQSFSAKEQALIERYLRGVVTVYDRFLEGP
jgi:DNA-binding MarR family transcriptional regulator